MTTEKEIKQQLEDLGALKELIETYEEIAISRMRKIRSSVLTTRDFMMGLAQILGEVKSSYQDQINRLVVAKKIKQNQNFSLLKHNGKTITVFLSANTGLYGEIVQKTFYSFVDYMKQHPDEESVVIGRLGKKLLEDAGFSKNITFYELSDGLIDRNAIRNILEKLLAYEKILVFYGKFQSVVTQNPEMMDLYGAEVPNVGSVESKAAIKYLFEPSLESILQFFETEILAAIFEQTIQESNLAKYASRMVSLDSAADNINNEIGKTRFSGIVARHRSINRKQLNTLSGFSLWKIT